MTWRGLKGVEGKKRVVKGREGQWRKEKGVRRYEKGM